MTIRGSWPRRGILASGVLFIALIIMAGTAQAVPTTWDFRLQCLDTAGDCDGPPAGILGNEEQWNQSSGGPATITAKAVRRVFTRNSRENERLAQDAVGIGVLVNNTSDINDLDTMAQGREAIILELPSSSWRPDSMVLANFTDGEDFKLYGLNGSTDINDAFADFHAGGEASNLIFSLDDPCLSPVPAIVTCNAMAETMTVDFDPSSFGSGFQYLMLTTPSPATMDPDSFKLQLFGATTVLPGPSNDLPEPASLALFGLGLAGLGCALRRRSRAA